MPVSRREFLALLASLPALGAGRLAAKGTSVPVSEILTRIDAIRDPALRAVARASASRFLGVAAGTTARAAIADLESTAEGSVAARHRVSVLADIAVTTGDSAFLEEAVITAGALRTLDASLPAMTDIAMAAAELKSRAAADCVLGWLRSKDDPRQVARFLGRIAPLFRENDARDDFAALARSACERVEDEYYLEEGLRALQGLGVRVSRDWTPITRAETTLTRGSLGKKALFLARAASACCPQLAVEQLESLGEGAGDIGRLLAWAGAVAGLHRARESPVVEARPYWDGRFEAAGRLADQDDVRIAVRALVDVLPACWEDKELAIRIRRIAARYFVGGHYGPYFRSEIMRSTVEATAASTDHTLRSEVANAGLQSINALLENTSDVSFVLDVGPRFAALLPDPRPAIEGVIEAARRSGSIERKKFWTAFYRLHCQIECGHVLIESNRYEEGVALLNHPDEANMTGADFTDIVSAKAGVLPHLRPADRVSTFDALLSRLENESGVARADDRLLRGLVAQALT